MEGVLLCLVVLLLCVCLYEYCVDSCCVWMSLALRACCVVVAVVFVMFVVIACCGVIVCLEVRAR